MLSAIGNREIPIPNHIDIYHLSREIPASDKTALESVLDVDEELKHLEDECERLAHCDDLESQDRLNDIYERLDELGADKAATRAGRILHGLGFTAEMQSKKCKDFSGGSRKSFQIISVF